MSSYYSDSESSYESDESEYTLAPSLNNGNYFSQSDRAYGFVKPTKQRQQEALGNLNVNCDPMTRQALSNIYSYWKDVDLPKASDWLASNPRDGFGCFEKFGGKKVTATRNVLYI